MSTPEPDTTSNAIPRRFTFAYLAVMAAILIGVTLHGLRAPDVYWIHDDDNAIWLRTGFRPSLGMNREIQYLSAFRTHFELGTVPENAIATVDTFHDARIVVNNQMARDLDPTLERQPGTISRIEIDLAPFLQPGANELLIIVKHPLGPHMMKCSIPELGLFSGTTWEYAITPEEWAPAVQATGHVDLQRWKLTTPASLWIAMLVCIAALMVWTTQSGKSLATLIAPERLRYICMALLLAMGINNTFHLDLRIGMDAGHHFLYLDHMLQNKTLPLASDGMWAFRSPLFYLIAIVPYALLNALFEADTAQVLIRIVPVLMSLGMVEIMYRIARELYPENPARIALGTIIGAFIPINIYLFQFPIDEPAAGLAGAFTVLVALRLLKKNAPLSNRDAALAGLAMGLAFLAKVSTALLAFPCLFVLIYCQLTQRPVKLAPFLKPILVALTVCFLVSGWYYIRNLIHLGTFAVMGWDAQYEWWQFPGYRANSHLLSFGVALANPMFAGATSFWDSLYSSLWADGWNSGVLSMPSVWNYPLQKAASWLALALTALMFIGLAAPAFQLSLGKDTENTLRNRAYFLATTLLLLYTVSILHHFILFPAYSSAKASYYIAILPCLVILILRGLDTVEARFGDRTARCVHVLIVIWAVFSFTAYWVNTQVELL